MTEPLDRRFWKKGTMQVVDRFLAGESLATIAESMGVPLALIEETLRIVLRSQKP